MVHVLLKILVGGIRVLRILGGFLLNPKLNSKSTNFGCSAEGRLWGGWLVGVLVWFLYWCWVWFLRGNFQVWLFLLILKLRGVSEYVVQGFSEECLY